MLRAYPTFIFWLKDESLKDFENLPVPDVLVKEIAVNLKSVLKQFNGINENLKEE